MKEKVKKILKKLVSDKLLAKYRRSIYLRNKNNPTNLGEKLKCLLLTKNIKIYNSKNFSSIMKKTKEELNFSNHFCYFIDFSALLTFRYQINNNMSPNYQLILEHSLSDYKKIYKNNISQLQFINELECFLDLFVEKISQSNCENKDLIISNLTNIKNKKCQSFLEALQRILFFNQLFWQMGYNLIGLGRLDFILNYYYEKDIKNSIINKSQVSELMNEFYSLLHIHYHEKSNCLHGDTGQIIVLGGIDKKGKAFSNDLTFLFMDVLKEFKKPDPKIFLRVNKDIDSKLLKKAINLIATGIGSPVISNDDVIIPRLIDFGYDKEDAWNYIPAACWEPSISGKSIDLNNAGVLNILDPLQKILVSDEFNNWESFVSNYLSELSIYINQRAANLIRIEYDSQHYLSLFIEECLNQKKTLSDKVVKYKNIGFTVVGVSNVVNSLLNVKKIVYENKLYSFSEFNNYRKNNFEEKEVLDVIRNYNKNGYGSNNIDAIELTNNIIRLMAEELKKHQTYFGGKFKFGLSAPSYVEIGSTMMASFDGRKNNQSLGVHISSNYNSYIDIMDFSSKINYPDSCINGNLTDFILNPFYIKNNQDKFIKIIEYYLSKGIYQIQINVMDSKTLILAKKNPDMYKNLIVRVWGFSAYFNDLPEEYKDLMIERALQSERTLLQHEQ